MSGVANEYGRWRHIDYRPALRDVSAEHLAPYLHSGQRVLEVGCNSGRTALWLATRGVEVVGIDINPQAILQAREEAKNLANGHARFIEGDFLDQPDIGAFDLVVMIRVLTCFSQRTEWEALLQRVLDCLAAGGLVYVHDFVMAPDYANYGDRYRAGAQRGWRTGNFAASKDRDMLFVAHHHTMAEITEISKPYETIFLNFHDSVSLNGNACRMFEFLGKRS